LGKKGNITLTTMLIVLAWCNHVDRPPLVTHNGGFSWRNGEAFKLILSTTEGTRSTSPRTTLTALCQNLRTKRKSFIYSSPPFLVLERICFPNTFGCCCELSAPSEGHLFSPPILIESRDRMRQRSSHFHPWLNIRRSEILREKLACTGRNLGTAQGLMYGGVLKTIITAENVSLLRSQDSIPGHVEAKRWRVQGGQPPDVLVARGRREISLGQRHCYAAAGAP
jgi:hypothetical protein